MRWRALIPAAAAVLTTVTLAGCASTVTAQPTPAHTGADIAAARASLDTLAVKGRAPKTGYERGCKPGQGCVFGPAWSDDVSVAGGHNGCGTRDDILARDLRNVVKSGACKVISGVLDDPYTGATIEFRRGADTSDDVQIDHVVAMSNAWQTGAQDLSPERRRDFANDPDNLQAVSGAANQQKGDSDAASWLPSQNRCAYIARQIAIKARYQLWVTPAERDAMTRVLSAC